MRAWIIIGLSLPLSLLSAQESNSQQELQTSPRLPLSIVPDKNHVYVGEPLRVELNWWADLPANRLSALQINPAFFFDPKIEAVIPRSTAPEAQQIGLPIGGRRAIATRHLDASDKAALGTIQLPLYLRFNHVGITKLAAVELKTAFARKSQNELARYAAYFNNRLFEPIDPEQAIQILHTKSSPLEIEVKALPPTPQDSIFSGLFAPLELSVSLHPTEVKIGDLMTLEIKVESLVPHSLLSLPALQLQPNLRERFLVNDPPHAIWQPDSTLFRTQIRVLSTTVKAFPALNDYENAGVPLTKNPEGVRHNSHPKLMHELLNIFYGLLTHGFWPLLLLGPCGFIILFPIVRERHRRANDARYRQIKEAYRIFKLSQAPDEQWQAFIHLLGICFAYLHH
ncbi:hypothetical protein QEH59_09895 [Coraliomargarita sp. SDUM461004]|uniref:Protein BatD n=1 Tax=Thalassobacterium sedimentorum TaxID=3041258 RepID=A0ABU1AJ62_9BACT|nr:hypothetical protein [Coraliomargarita sp. SDUM461004]MDQ8194737.1 hypothetical protein [Coraliomargarita sp. SDUM461004]